MKDRLLTLEQLDEQLMPVRKLMPSVPRMGWVKTLRTALGLTAAQLAKRLGVVPSRVMKIETAETEGAITVQTLRAVATAMNCQFVYAFVPNDNFTNEIIKRADKLATEQLARVAHTMQLEDQTVKTKRLEKYREQLRSTILSRAWKHLWQN